jgi:carbonic anhydrase
MPQVGETFFTIVGCMDGRVQGPAAEFGRQKFGAEYPDTITEAGLVGKLAQENTDQELLDSVKNKLDISFEKHHSKGIVVHGHQECVGNPVSDDEHKDEIRKSVQKIKSLINSSVPVVGAFAKRSSKHPSKWEVEEISPTVLI